MSMDIEIQETKEKSSKNKLEVEISFLEASIFSHHSWSKIRVSARSLAQWLRVGVGIGRD